MSVRCSARCLVLRNSGLGHRSIPLMVISAFINTYDCMQCASPASGVMRLTPKGLRAFGF